MCKAKEVRRHPVVGHSPATSPRCVYGRNGHLKLQSSSPAGKQQAPEPCFCSSGCGANQEMQDESISEKQNKGKMCTQIQHGASQRDLNISLMLKAKA